MAYLFKRIFFVPVSLPDFKGYSARLEQLQNLPISTRDIVFLGDSLIEYGEWRELLEHPHIKNRGIGLDRAEGVLDRLSSILEGKPEKIFLMVGINDLGEGQDIDEILQNYRKILHRIGDASSGTKIFAHSILPVNTGLYRGKVSNTSILELNRGIEQLAREYSMVYIDLFNYFADSNRELKLEFTYDGIHLNGKGYLAWRERLKPFIGPSTSR